MFPKKLFTFTGAQSLQRLVLPVKAAPFPLRVLDVALLPRVVVFRVVLFITRVTNFIIIIIFRPSVTVSVQVCHDYCALTTGQQSSEFFLLS